MSTNISRRKVVAGAAWAAPVVAASAAVPAFASSTECDWNSTENYSISGQPSGARRLLFPLRSTSSASRSLVAQVAVPTRLLVVPVLS